MARYAFVVAGTHSGVGKTTVSLGLMAHLVRRGYVVQPFKVGPDFIDPGLHTIITGRVSRNLDGWMLSPSYNRDNFVKASSDADIAIVEGVMGIYDGYNGKGESGSTAEMAKWLDIPVILVVDARSMARSVAALVSGYANFDPGVRWAGCVLNRVAGDRHYCYLKEALEAYLPHIPIIGWIPADYDISLPERHLGLITADEAPIGSDWVIRAANMVSHHLDVNMLLKASQVKSNPPADWIDDASRNLKTNRFSKPIKRIELYEEKVFIVVPRDPAFCFYYQDNLDLLAYFGAEMVFISPLSGDTIPDNADGVYIGGGYPELHVEKLAENRGFLKSLSKCVHRGVPVYAECGGMMVLGRFIETLEGRFWPMAGVLPFGVRMLPRRKALGYTGVYFRKDCILGPKGTVVRGHEFHYSEVCELTGRKGEFFIKQPLSPKESQNSIDLVYELAQSKSSETSRFEGYSTRSLLASYVHQHWGSNPKVAGFFVRSAQKVKNQG